MSHPVALTPPLAGAAAVKQYPGYGIRGADISATGDTSGSVVLNDGIAPDSEYYWRVVTPPAAGVLTIFPDLSHTHTDAADGTWPWVYELFADGVSLGTATVYSTFGAAGSLAANGDSQASGTAAAAATVTIPAAALVQAAGTAGLSANVLIAAAGAAQAAGDAGLSAQLQAMASGAGQASGTATLTESAQGGLTAAGHAAAGGASALTVTVWLQAAGASASSALAAAMTAAPGSASAHGAALAEGQARWATTVTLSAAGFVQAMGAGRATFVVDVPPPSALVINPKYLVRAPRRNYMVRY